MLTVAIIIERFDCESKMIFDEEKVEGKGKVKGGEK